MGGLKSNPLDRALVISHYDVVPSEKWLVQQDREGGKQVSQDGLYGQSYRDAYDAQSGDQRANVDARVAEDEEESDGPQSQPTQQSYCFDGRQHAGVHVAFFTQELVRIEHDRCVQPQPGL